MWNRIAALIAASIVQAGREARVQPYGKSDELVMGMADRFLQWLGQP